VQPTHLECSDAAPQHRLEPLDLAFARPPWAHWIRAAHREVHGHGKLPVSEDDHQQQPVDSEHRPLLLTAVPRADEPQLRAMLAEDAVIGHPRHLPATASRRAHLLDPGPERLDDLAAEALELLEPASLRQRAQDAPGQVAAPAQDAPQLLIGARPEERREHHREDLAHQLPLDAYLAGEALNQASLEAKIFERAFEIPDVALSCLLTLPEPITPALTPLGSTPLIFEVDSLRLGHASAPVVLERTVPQNSLDRNCFIHLVLRRPDAASGPRQSEESGSLPTTACRPAHIIRPVVRRPDAPARPPRHQVGLRRTSTT
jgi:hypothetical protein